MLVYRVKQIRWKEKRIDYAPRRLNQRTGRKRHNKEKKEERANLEKTNLEGGQSTPCHRSRSNNFNKSENATVGGVRTL